MGPMGPVVGGGVGTSTPTSPLGVMAWQKGVQKPKRLARRKQLGRKVMKGG